MSYHNGLPQLRALVDEGALAARADIESNN